jgi:threonine synthase
VVAQVVYYFRGYLKATTSNEQKVSFTVPSGNFGNICAGHIARMMGLPIDKLVVATNENNVLDEFFRTGVYRVRKSPRPTTPAARRWTSRRPRTSSASSTTWSAATPSARTPCSTRSRPTAASTCRARRAATATNSSGRRSTASSRAARTHEDRLATIRFVFDDYGITIDTHTADGIKVAREHIEPGVPMIVLETALAGQVQRDHPAKRWARDAERPAGFENIEALPQRFDVMAGCRQ